MLMMKKYLKYGCIVVGILVLVLACGCTAVNSSVSGDNSHQDPETGLIAWIDAVNAHDVNGLYNLAPDWMKDNISLEQFTSANANNTLMTPDKSITGYKILNETSNTTIANIKVAVFLHQNVPGNSTQTQTIPLYLNFEEWFEHGEWKVSASPMVIIFYKNLGLKTNPKNQIPWTK